MEALMGPLIGAGGSAGGGLVSNIFNRQNMKWAQAKQREDLQNMIFWRVQDAKSSGIHPLFALGASPAMSSPMVLGDALGPALADAGQSLGNAVHRMLNAEDKAKQWLDYKIAMNTLLEGDARINYIRSQTALNEQAAMSGGNNGLGIQSESGQVPNVPGSNPGLPGSGAGMINKKAADVTSSKADAPHITAGTRPAYEVRDFGNGFPIVLPVAEGESPEEIISEMSFPAWAGLLQRNARFWGEGWMKDMINQRYLGRKPSRTYDSKRSLKDF